MTEPHCGFDLQQLLVFIYFHTPALQVATKFAVTCKLHISFQSQKFRNVTYRNMKSIDKMS